MFTVDVLIRVLVPRRYFIRESNLLSFRIQDSGSGQSVKGDFPKAWSGVVAPILPWVTDIRPLESGVTTPGLREKSPDRKKGTGRAKGNG
jgi:hypothetical protein